MGIVGKEGSKTKGEASGEGGACSILLDRTDEQEILVHSPVLLD